MPARPGRACAAPDPAPCGGPCLPAAGRAEFVASAQGRPGGRHGCFHPRVVLASQPQWNRRVCPREVSELPSGFSPVRPCEARLRHAGVKDLYGRETHVVFPSLCASAVLSSLCSVNCKPQNTLNVFLCEQQHAVPTSEVLALACQRQIVVLCIPSGV